MTAEPAERTIRASHPVDVRLTLGAAGRRPTTIVDGAAVWRATWTPEGAASVRVAPALASRGVHVQAWGPGAGWAVEHATDLCGLDDGAEAFAAVATRHPVVARLARAMPGLRIPRSQAVYEAAVVAVLEQKVVGADARASYRALVGRYGSPAPGPAAAIGLRLPPPARAVAAIPSYAFRPLGVEAKRADTIRRVAANARWVDGLAALPAREARRWLTTLPGVGPWTASEVALVALGDGDAVSIGDFHLPNTIAWALAGEPRGDDARMLELLAPFEGHRGRVTRLVEAARLFAPRFGPRMPRQRALL